MRRVQAGPLVGFVGVLALLAPAGRDGGPRRGRVGDGGCLRVVRERGTRSRPRPPRLRRPGPGRPGHAHPGGARCGVAALTADSFGAADAGGHARGAHRRSPSSLDAVDGQVARRTGTVSALGARFDMEVDAFLILVLSVYVAPDRRLVGAGDRAGALRAAARRADAAVAAPPGAAAALAQGGRGDPGHRAGAWPPRTCCPDVLSVAGARRGPGPAGRVLRPRRVVAVAAARQPRSCPRSADRWPGARVVAGPDGDRRAPALTVWFALVVPNDVDRPDARGVRADPARGAAAARARRWSLRPLARRVSAVVVRAGAGAAGGREGPGHGLQRGDGPAVRPGQRLGLPRPGLRSAGRLDRPARARSRPLVVVALLVGRGAGPDAAVGGPADPAGAAAPRDVAARRGGRWPSSGCCARCPGCSSRPARPVASTQRPPTWRLREVGQVRAGIAGPGGLREARSRTTTIATSPANRLLTGLRGKDVLLVFVESYGRVAVQDSDFSPEIDAVLDNGTDRLRGRGVLLAQRVPDLADVRRGQLAGALHAAVGAVGQQPAALQPARSPDDRTTLTSAFRAGGLADRVRRTRDHARLAGGRGVLRVRPALRLHEHPVRRPEVRLRATCPTSTRSPPSAGWSWRPPTGSR